MKFVLAIASLAATAVASDWSYSCRDAKLDPATEVLSATCNIGDGKGTFADTSLDLNDCLKYEDGKIEFGLDGHFGDSCNDCFLYTLPDPGWPITRPWMNCSCSESGSNTLEAAINLDTNPILNKYGKLQCIY